jgi:phospholipid transport system substrate-binding protein
MASRIRTLVLSTVAALALGFTTIVASPGVAFAGEAQNLVQGRHSEVVAKLKGAASAERDKQVAGILGGLFDYDTMAERSMGTHWASLTDDQKAEFKTVLRQLIQKNLEKSIKSTLKYDVEYLGEEPSGDTIIVKTKASNKSNQREEPVTIDYRMQKKGTEWRAIDVVTEGSSMVNNYKSQFNKIINKDGYPGLLKKMKSRLGASA